MMIIVLPILVMKNKYIMERNILLTIQITVSVTSHSKEESGEEETDAEVEDTVDNGKGNLSTPVSRKGVTSD